MLLQVLRIVNQGRCFAKLIGNFAMSIEKLVKLRQVPASDVIARDPADLVAILFALSPIDEKRINLWKVYLAFWDWAARDPAVTRPHRRQFEIALRRIAQAIETRYGKREDLDSVSERILAIVQGIAIQTLMDQERWPPARVRLRLTEEVNSLLGAG